MVPAWAVSGFDQVLAEDRSVNRLEDSVLLWKSVCSNKLLQNVDLVIFLNKCDILEKKLNAGVRVSKYVRSYGDRPNDLDTVSKCQYRFPWNSYKVGTYCPIPQISEPNLARYIGNTHQHLESFMAGARL